MTIAAREIHLKSRPTGLPGPENFEFTERALPAPAEGQLLVRTLWMSVDPYMRGRMVDRPSYIEPFQVGQPLEGDAVSVVEQSRDARLKPGDFVSGPAVITERETSTIITASREVIMQADGCLLVRAKQAA